MGKKWWQKLASSYLEWRARIARNRVSDVPRSHVERLPVLVSGASQDRTVRRALLALLIGGIIVFRHHLPVIHELFARLDRYYAEPINHVGIAFLISAIVTFAYEWGSEAKKSAALTAELVNVLDAHIESVLDASDREAIQTAMKRLSRDDENILAPQFLKFADAVGRLAQGDWAAPAYLAFIRQYHKELTEKARLLADMSDALRDDPGATGAEFRVPMPNAVTLADTIVKSTLEELKARGGRYDAVSDAATWKSLTNYSNMHTSSFERVETRRIFVLGLTPDDHIPPGYVTGVVHEHFTKARESKGRYSIKITTKEEYQHRRHIPELTDSMNFGIFIPDQGAAIAFLVIDEQLSNFRITAAPSEMLLGYEDLWREFDDLKEAPIRDGQTMTVGEGILQDYLLAYRIRRMPHGTLYRGLSLAWSWLEAVFERFTEASEQVIPHLKIRRIFVFEPQDAKDQRILGVIAKHSDFAAKSHGHYEWRVCMRTDLSKLEPNLDLKPGLAIFEGGSEQDGGQLMNEVAVGSSDFDQRPRTFQIYSRLFDQFWSTLEFESSIRNVFGDRADEVLRLAEEARNRHTPEPASP